MELIGTQFGLLTAENLEAIPSNAALTVQQSFSILSGTISGITSTPYSLAEWKTPAFMNQVNTKTTSASKCLAPPTLP